jgi:hypothetical protein
MFDSHAAAATLVHLDRRQPGRTQAGPYRAPARPRPVARPVIDPASLAAAPFAPRDRFYAGVGIVIAVGFSALCWAGLAALVL